jgi:hypothetical protein
MSSELPNPAQMDRLVTCGNLTITGIPEYLSVDDLQVLALVCLLALDGVLPPARVEFGVIRSHLATPAFIPRQLVESVALNARLMGPRNP